MMYGTFALLWLTAAGMPAPQESARTKNSAAGTVTGERKLATRPCNDTLNIAGADSLRATRGIVATDSAMDAGRAAGLPKAPDTTAPHQFRYVRNESFGIGERLVFDVNYGFITAGEAVMEIPAYDSVAGRRCFRVEFRVNSLPSFSWIYRVADRYLTFIDEQTIAPWKFEQHVREGNYSRDFVADFDQIHNVAHTTEGSYPIPEYVHDIMSAFYYARTVDYSNLKTGDQYTLSNFYKDKTYELAVKVLGRQELEVEAGTFRTIVVEPMVKEGGLFKSEGRIVIWLTDDDRKIPVRVNTKVIIGSIDTELREYSGLRGPLGAKIR